MAGHPEGRELRRGSDSRRFAPSSRESSGPASSDTGVARLEPTWTFARRLLSSATAVASRRQPLPFVTGRGFLTQPTETSLRVIASVSRGALAKRCQAPTLLTWNSRGFQPWGNHGRTRFRAAPRTSSAELGIPAASPGGCCQDAVRPRVRTPIARWRQTPCASSPTNPTAPRSSGRTLTPATCRGSRLRAPHPSSTHEVSAPADSGGCGTP
jgi:hypothetical protein